MLVPQLTAIDNAQHLARPLAERHKRPGAIIVSLFDTCKNNFQIEKQYLPADDRLIDFTVQYLIPFENALRSKVQEVFTRFLLGLPTLEDLADTIELERDVYASCNAEIERELSQMVQENKERISREFSEFVSREVPLPPYMPEDDDVGIVPS